jgi:outer membrane protein
MKKTILKLTLAVFTLVCLGFAGANGQQAHRIGYIDFQDLMQQMPEYKKANSDMEAFSKRLETELKNLSAELEKKYEDYQKQEASMVESIKDMKQKELRDMQARIQEFQTKAQQDVRSEEERLLKPIIEKAKKGISDVAKENNFYYVFDSSPGSPLLYKPDGENMLSLVRKKLGIGEITSPVVPPAPQK